MEHDQHALTKKNNALMIRMDKKREKNRLSNEAKAKALKSRTKDDGFDGHKRWGNSAVKGHGVNSPAMMEARKKFDNK